MKVGHHLKTLTKRVPVAGLFMRTFSENVGSDMDDAYGEGFSIPGV